MNTVTDNTHPFRCTLPMGCAEGGASRIIRAVDRDAARRLALILWDMDAAKHASTEIAIVQLNEDDAPAGELQLVHRWNPVSLEQPGELKRLYCCCCGERTPGRQWYNRDTGYGLCDDCIKRCKVAHLERGDISNDYGIRGIHWDVSSNPSHATT